jgi:hypothetical protein
MLSIGDGIAVVGVVATAGLTIIKIYAAKLPGESSILNVNGNGKYVSKEVCTVQHAETNRRLSKIEEKLDQILDQGMIFNNRKA